MSCRGHRGALCWPFEGGDRHVLADPAAGLAGVRQRPGPAQARAAVAGRIAALPGAGAGALQRPAGGLARQHRPDPDAPAAGCPRGLAEIVEANRQDGDKAKPAALVDAYPGLGKSTAVREYGRDYWRPRSRCAARPPLTGTAGSRSSTSR